MSKRYHCDFRDCKCNKYILHCNNLMKIQENHHKKSQSLGGLLNNIKLQLDK